MSRQQINEEKANAGLQLIALSNMTGGKAPDYSEGVLAVEFTNKDALDHFLNALDNLEFVENYEIRTNGPVDQETGYDALDDEIHVVVIVYVQEDHIDYGEYEMDQEYDTGDALDGVMDPQAVTITNFSNEPRIDELERKIRVNSRGVKTVKMKCNPGYKYNAAAKSCQKITGAELSTRRKSLRRAVLTKRSMGQSFKMRVVRKTRKAMRYRAALGLK